ncbi:hypothetical protein LXL04_025969 [Taraxacum kok-saghyz]
MRLEKMKTTSFVGGKSPSTNNLPLGGLNNLVFLCHPTLVIFKPDKSSKLPVPKNKLKPSQISLVAAAPHHQVLEGPVEAPISSNSVVANPATDSVVVNTATDSSPISTGLDTPPDPEIH